MNTVLEVANVEKYYGNKGNLTKALDKISFQVEEGEFVGIMGASGSGKTTLLNCLSTIDRITSGKIVVDDVDITRLKGNHLNRFRREELGFIFQDFNLLDTLTAYENIALALTIQRVKPGKIEKDVKKVAEQLGITAVLNKYPYEMSGGQKQRVACARAIVGNPKLVLADEPTKKVAEQLGITAVLNKYPYEMSGGQKQRVACARAIVGNPKLVLADEPTGALDSKAARMLLENFQFMNQKLGATILMVTHDAFTASYADRILFIKDGKLFNELHRGEDSRKEFFGRIIEVVTLLGGELNDVI